MTTCGPEQEYFLIDRQFYFNRPDLINAGRTLFGAKPPKGQEMEDHYFGSIPDRVLAFMMEAERELYKVGVPIKTRHNEVAPSQYEVAPIFENANVATDHQMMTMEILRRTAPKFGLACLLHEKPFAGVNGSGKHLNWSMSDDLGNNLLNPGDTPHDNIQFLVFCAAVLRAVNKFQGLLRFSIASAGNDHRLGANEAPPAIISIFLGDMLTDIFQQIEKAGSAKTTKSGGIMDIGVNVLPKLPRDAGDRNRTSPFAFTGNKFEFRAVSSNQSIALPNVALNVAVTESLDYVATELEKELKEGKKLQDAVKALLTKLIKDNKRIIFNGNGYADEWQKEAGKRGLLNLRTSVDAYGEAIKPDVVKAFEKYGVLNEREIHARYEVALEQYNKTVNIEAQLMVLMANRYILPAAYKHQEQLANTVAAVKAAGATAKETRRALDEICKLTDAGQAARRRPAEAAGARRERRRRRSTPKYFRDKVIPAMDALREVGDALEEHRPAGPLAAPDLPGDALREIGKPDTPKAGFWPGGQPNRDLRPTVWNGGSSYVPHCRARRSRRPRSRRRPLKPRPGAPRRPRRRRLLSNQHDVRRLRGRPRRAARHGPGVRRHARHPAGSERRGPDSSAARARPTASPPASAPARGGSPTRRPRPTRSGW